MTSYRKRLPTFHRTDRLGSRAPDKPIRSDKRGSIDLEQDFSDSVEAKLKQLGGDKTA
ncbi:MAG TPA: hypothetical protein VL134_04515 [Leptolyngbya sp.]|nr:hypothetical protein [Leptolyngbya sp.]